MIIKQQKNNLISPVALNDKWISFKTEKPIWMNHILQEYWSPSYPVIQIGYSMTFNDKQFMNEKYLQYITLMLTAHTLYNVLENT